MVSASLALQAAKPARIRAVRLISCSVEVEWTPITLPTEESQEGKALRLISTVQRTSVARLRKSTKVYWKTTSFMRAML